MAYKIVFQVCCKKKEKSWCSFSCFRSCQFSRRDISIYFEARVFTIMADLTGYRLWPGKPGDSWCCLLRWVKLGPWGQKAWECNVWPWSSASLPAVIPKVTKHLLSNPVFTCIILAACMEIAVVAGFAAFLGKYLEQQFNLTTSSANQLLGESVSQPPRGVERGHHCL